MHCQNALRIDKEIKKIEWILSEKINLSPIIRQKAKENLKEEIRQDEKIQCKSIIISWGNNQVRQ